MNKDTSHLVALTQGLAHERDRLAKATNPKEIALRTVWVSQYENEIGAEFKFLEMPATLDEVFDDDALLGLLNS